MRTDGKQSVMSTFKLRSDIVDKLNRYSAETGVTKTFAVEKALEQYLGRYEDEKRREAIERESMKGGAGA